MECQILIVSLCIIAWIDIAQKKIPNLLLLILMIVRSCFLKIDGAEFSTSIIGFFTGGVILLFVYLLAEEKIGAGDVKLIAVVGYYIGSDKILELLFLSFMTAGIFCIVQRLYTVSGSLGKIPFAPFVLTAILILFL